MKTLRWVGMIWHPFPPTPAVSQRMAPEVMSRAATDEALGRYTWSPNNARGAAAVDTSIDQTTTPVAAFTALTLALLW